MNNDLPALCILQGPLTWNPRLRAGGQQIMSSTETYGYLEALILFLI